MGPSLYAAYPGIYFIHSIHYSLCPSHHPQQAYHKESVPKLARHKCHHHLSEPCYVNDIKHVPITRDQTQCAIATWPQSSSNLRCQSFSIHIFARRNQCTSSIIPWATCRFECAVHEHGNAWSENIEHQLTCMECIPMIHNTPENKAKLQ